MKDNFKFRPDKMDDTVFIRVHRTNEGNTLREIAKHENATLSSVCRAFMLHGMNAYLAQKAKEGQKDGE